MFKICPARLDSTPQFLFSFRKILSQRQAWPTSILSSGHPCMPCVHPAALVTCTLLPLPSPVGDIIHVECTYAVGGNVSPWERDRSEDTLLSVRSANNRTCKTHRYRWLNSSHPRWHLTAQEVLTSNRQSSVQINVCRYMATYDIFSSWVMIFSMFLTAPWWLIFIYYLL